VDVLRGWWRTPAGEVCDGISELCTAYRIERFIADQFSFAFLQALLTPPLDATRYNQLISQSCPLRIDFYCSTQSEPKQGFVLFELTRANEISLSDSYKKSLSECCIN
jgi:hypothetical protein